MDGKKNKKIIISEEDKYEGNSCIDYLISSMNEMKNKISEIHFEIAYKSEFNKDNTNFTKEEENKINEEFNKKFNIKENNKEAIFEYLNDINLNHIKQYKKIFTNLNLNLIAEHEHNNIINYNDINNNEKIVDELKIKINPKKYNEEIIINNIDNEENEENKLIENEIINQIIKPKKEIQIQIRNENYETIEKEKEKEKENNTTKDNEKMEIEEQEQSSQINGINKDKLLESDYLLNDESNPICEMKVNIVKNNIYFNNNILEDDKDNEFDNDNDNEIIINENDDSISQININEYVIKNKRNKQKKISLKNISNRTSTLIEQITIINDNYDSNYSFYKNNNKVINTIPVNQYNKEYNNINYINSDNNKNNIINDFEYENYKKEDTKNNLNDEQIKNNKNKRKQLEQKLNKKDNQNNNATTNLLYSGLDDKSEICTCFLF